MSIDDELGIAEEILAFKVQQEEFFRSFTLQYDAQNKDMEEMIKEKQRRDEERNDRFDRQLQFLLQQVQFLTNGTCAVDAYKVFEEIPNSEKALEEEKISANTVFVEMPKGEISVGEEINSCNMVGQMASVELGENSRYTPENLVENSHVEAVHCSLIQHAGKDKVPNVVAEKQKEKTSNLEHTNGAKIRLFVPYFPKCTANYMDRKDSEIVIKSAGDSGRQSIVPETEKKGLDGSWVIKEKTIPFKSSTFQESVNSLRSSLTSTLILGCDSCFFIIVREYDIRKARVKEWCYSEIGSTVISQGRFENGAHNSEQIYSFDPGGNLFDVCNSKWLEDMINVGLTQIISSSFLDSLWLDNIMTFLYSMVLYKGGKISGQEAQDNTITIYFKIVVHITDVVDDVSKVGPSYLVEKLLAKSAPILALHETGDCGKTKQIDIWVIVGAREDIAGDFHHLTNDTTLHFPLNSNKFRKENIYYIVKGELFCLDRFMSSSFGFLFELVQSKNKIKAYGSVVPRTTEQANCEVANENAFCSTSDILKFGKVEARFYSNDLVFTKLILISKNKHNEDCVWDCKAGVSVTITKGTTMKSFNKGTNLGVCEANSYMRKLKVGKCFEILKVFKKVLSVKPGGSEDKETKEKEKVSSRNGDYRYNIVSNYDKEQENVLTFFDQCVLKHSSAHDFDREFQLASEEKNKEVVSLQGIEISKGKILDQAVRDIATPLQDITVKSKETKKMIAREEGSTTRIYEALEVVELDGEAKPFGELNRCLLRCLRYQYRKSMLEVCVESSTTEKHEFTISTFLGQVSILTTHSYDPVGIIEQDHDGDSVNEAAYTLILDKEKGKGIALARKVNEYHWTNKFMTECVVYSSKLEAEQFLEVLFVNVNGEAKLNWMHNSSKWGFICYYLFNFGQLVLLYFYKIWHRWKYRRGLIRWIDSLSYFGFIWVCLPQVHLLYIASL